MTNVDYSPDKSENIVEPDQCRLANSVEDIFPMIGLVCRALSVRPIGRRSSAASANFAIPACIHFSLEMFAENTLAREPIPTPVVPNRLGNVVARNAALYRATSARTMREPQPT